MTATISPGRTRPVTPCNTRRFRSFRPPCPTHLASSTCTSTPTRRRSSAAPALGGGRNERLWFKVSLKLCSLLLQQRAWGRLERTLDALRAHCTLADGSADSRKGTQLLEVLSVEIQMRTELRQAKALKGLYQRALRVKGAIPHPKVLGVIRECGGKMHMGARAWGAAATDFFEAFRSFDEAGAARRVKCLKYLVLAQMLAASDVDPFDAPETKPYKNDPEVLAMTSLIGAYQRGDAQEFRAVLERNEGAIMGDPFIRVHMESLLRQVREQVLLKLLRPYRSMRVAFAARELGVAPEEVEAMLVTLILDGKVQGRLDQVEGTLELECTDSGAQHLHEAVLGLSRSFGSFARAAGLRLHVAAPGVLPAADMMEDAARAVGSALREALQPVAS